MRQFACRADPRPQRIEPVEREGSVHRFPRHRDDAHEKRALSWKRLQQRDHIALERDAVTRRRRGAFELPRPAAIHAIENEIFIGWAGEATSPPRHLRASTAP